MWNIDREQAKKAGYTDQEIDEYLAGLNTQATPVPGATPTPPGSPRPQPQELLGQTPDVVDPFVQPETSRVTQLLGENPGFYGQGGHQGLDMVNENPTIQNPIGGLHASGYQPGGYGFWDLIIGANKQELAQMSPEEKQAIIEKATNYINSGASDLRGLDLPGKNVSLQGHLDEPTSSEPEIATGAARMKMGGSGGWAPHLHQEFKNTAGNIIDMQNLLGNYLLSENYYGGVTDYNKMVEQEIKKRTRK